MCINLSVFKMMFLSIILFLGIIVAGCGGGSGILVPNVVPDGTKILVANSLGETLSLVGFQNSTYVTQNNFVQTGQAPNQIIVRGSICYVLNSLSNSVLALDANTFTLIYETSVGLGKNPFNMAFINNDEVIITNWLGNDCVRMNLNPSYGLNRIIATIPLPKYPDLPKDQSVKENLGCPEAVVIVGDKAYITLANLNKKDFVAGGPGFVALVDLQSNQYLSTIQTTGRNTIGLCLDPFNNQKLYVLSAGDMNPSTWIYDGNGKIDVLDIGLLGITSSIDVNGAPFEMLVAPNGMGYITDGMEGKILTLDTSTHYFKASIELAVEGEMGYASGLALLNGDFLFALEFNQDELVIIDLKTSNTIVDRIKTGDGPDAITILP